MAEPQMQAAHFGCRGIGFADGKITFTLPAINDPDMIRAFTHLAAAMAQQAKEQKHIRLDETIEENEKYYMRIWLLRLGFGGAEGKEVRNLLLKNLKGNAAFRTEGNKERWKEARRNEKEAVKQQGQEAAAAQPEQDTAEATAQERQDSGTEVPLPAEIYGRRCTTWEFISGKRNWTPCGRNTRKGAGWNW